MRVEKLGEGEPEVAIVGSIHGDEPCGKKAIERFIQSDIAVEKPVKFIIANEKALEKDTRYVEKDLNRSFPGDISSEVHEERLAARILEQVEGMNVLSIHSTKSYEEPFAAQSILNEEIMDLVKKTGVEIVSHGDEELGCLGEYARAVEAECGFQESDQAAENAFKLMKNFLAANKVIDEDYSLSDPEVFDIYETVREPDFKFVASNFQKVEEGEVYALDDGEEVRAEEDFYPVLMSTNGYSSILGHKAKKVKKSDYA